MAQSIQTINLVAPGFMGLNTEESPLAQDARFASTADNCVIDRYGRIAAREGFSAQTTDIVELDGQTIHKVHVFEDIAGNEIVFSAGNNKILSGVTTLVDETPSGYTINNDNWDIVNFNDGCYFFQAGQEPLVYSASSGAVEPMSDIAGFAVNPARAQMDGDTVIAAYGRLWVAGFNDDPHTIYWSDLLIGHDWNGGSSGSIDVARVWPDGYDEIVKIEAHNDFLIVFGRHSIILYSGAGSPSSMEVSDTISGMGARWRDGVVNIGTDVLFVAYDGLRGIGRAIQEKSLPINDLSRTIRADFINELNEQESTIQSVYSPENNFVIIALKDTDKIYCFDIRSQLENGAYRVTRWPNTGWSAFHRKDDGSLYLGSVDGIGLYADYQDNEASYTLTYLSQNLTFGDSGRLKILKKLKPTIIGGASASVTFRWSYGFDSEFKSVVTTLPDTTAAEYGEAEFGEAEFSLGIVTSTRNINASLSGTSVIVGMDAEINGAPLSLQEMNVFTLIGKYI